MKEEEEVVEEEEKYKKIKKNGGEGSATKIRERLLDPRGTLRQQSSECENKGKLCGISI